jgi:hypothetical protein
MTLNAVWELSELCARSYLSLLVRGNIGGGDDKDNRTHTS